MVCTSERSYRDDSCAAVERCGYVVRGVADQDRLPSLVVLGAGLLGALTGDADEVGAVVVGAVRADVEIEKFRVRPLREPQVHVHSKLRKTR
jgi:hypothetical protein